MTVSAGFAGIAGALPERTGMRDPFTGTSPHPGRLTRRGLLQAGGLGCLGAALSGTLPAAAASADSRIRARSVILLWMDGGPAPQETFDPPAATSFPATPFGAVPTSVDGLRISGLMPRMARKMDRVTLIRTLHHPEGSHDRARRHLLTGRVPDPHRLYPTLPRVVAEHFGTGRIEPGQEPSAGREPVRLREAYGASEFGERCLAARRQVEAGAPFVTVTLSGWDSHSDHFASSRRLVPAADQAFAALLADLEDCGLLDHTLVVWMGEFGRSPRLNSLGGRDHWPYAGCVVLAGGGIPGGEVIGATDPETGMPQDRAVSPAELHAAILRRLGIPALPASAEPFDA